MYFKQLVVAFLALAATVAQAQGAGVRLFTNLGYSFGGDTLASGTYVGGDSWTIKAGQGLLMAAGGDVRLTENFIVRASVGYHHDSTNANNGEVSFTRTPIELLGFYEVNQQVMLGGGLRKATGARVKATGVATGLSSAGDYDSNLGIVLEGVYFFDAISKVAHKPLWGINLRLVSEEFKQTSNPVNKSGTHIALGLVFMY